MESFGGIDVNSDGEDVYHFYYWTGFTPGCPICGNVLVKDPAQVKKRTPERVKNHLEIVHYYSERVDDQGNPRVAKIMLDVIKPN